MFIKILGTALMLFFGQFFPFSSVIFGILGFKTLGALVGVWAGSRIGPGLL